MIGDILEDKIGEFTLNVHRQVLELLYFVRQSLSDLASQEVVITGH